MRDYEVEFGPEGAPAIEKATVKASSPDEAMEKVMSPFKDDPRVVDADVFTVKVRLVQK